MELINTIPKRLWPPKIILPEDIKVRVIDYDEEEMVVEIYKLDKAA